MFCFPSPTLNAKQKDLKCHDALVFLQIFKYTWHFSICYKHLKDINNRFKQIMQSFHQRNMSQWQQPIKLENGFIMEIQAKLKNMSFPLLTLIVCVSNGGMLTRTMSVWIIAVGS